MQDKPEIGLRVRALRALKLGAGSWHEALWRLRFVARNAGLVDRPLRFSACELLRPGSVRRVRPAASPVTLLLRHGIIDLPILVEVFGHRLYEPPDAIDHHLRSLGRPVRVADLGAHVGLFGAYVLGRHRDARITAFEADPLNAALLSNAIRLNALEEQWTMIHAIAGVKSATAWFRPGLGAVSRVLEAQEAGAVSLPTVDVFDHIAGADLIKIDIEGAEWPILADRRAGDLEAQAIVLEFHRQSAPADEAPLAAASRLLARAGYEPLPGRGPSDIAWPEGQGILWGVRRSDRDRESRPRARGT